MLSFYASRRMLSFSSLVVLVWALLIVQASAAQVGDPCPNKKSDSCGGSVKCSITQASGLDNSNGICGGTGAACTQDAYCVSNMCISKQCAAPVTVTMTTTTTTTAKPTTTATTTTSTATTTSAGPSQGAGGVGGGGKENRRKRALNIRKRQSATEFEAVIKAYNAAFKDQQVVHLPAEDEEKSPW